MLILALDSTAQVGSVALCEGDGHLLAECTLNTGNTHSETLLPMVESVLKIAGYTVDDDTEWDTNKKQPDFGGFDWEAEADE